MSAENLLYDRYRILRKLGAGAFATVYLADDLVMGRQVAVKVVEESRDGDGRALREAQAAAKLDHPHIVTVYEVAQEPGRTMLFTEYVEGHTLRELYVRRQLSDVQLLEAGIQLCRALEHAKKRGVVHRDIKPENIILADADEVDVRIMDFGVARLEDLSSITMDGELVGTLAYMAPEQLEGGQVNHKADVYSLALTLYEGFTGQNPARGKSVTEILKGPSRMVFSRLARVRPDLPPSLDRALSGGMEKDPAQRLDAGSLRRALEKTLKEMPEPEVVVPFGERVRATLWREPNRSRLVYFGRHTLAAALALACSTMVLTQVGFYPRNAIAPLILTVSFAALLLPTIGAASTLALISLPILAFSLGWGVIFLLLAASLLLLHRWARREWAFLLPGIAPLLVIGRVGLIFPALAALLLRRWAPLSAFLGGLLVAVVSGLEGWERLPFTFGSGPGPVLLATRHEASPVAVLDVFIEYLTSRPELFLQALLFAAFAVPFARFLREDSGQRLWVAAAYLGALLVAFVVLPPLLAGASVDLWAFLWAFLPCAIIVLLSAFLAPREGAPGESGGSGRGSPKEG